MQSHEHMLVRLMPGAAQYAVDTELRGADCVSPAANVWSDPAAVEVSRGPLQADRHESALAAGEPGGAAPPGSFEHAVDHLLESVLDLSHFDARFTNDATGAPAYRAPAYRHAVPLKDTVRPQSTHRVPASRPLRE